MKQGAIFRISLTVALAGFLMGFDASVISGVVSALEKEFALDKLQLGWAVACLTLSATLAMLISGPLSDRLGRRAVLFLAAAAFAISAILSAIASSYEIFIFARMLGGFGVGAALIVAPIYIAEIAPAQQRGRLVSLNQLNIVMGLSAAFFSNYLILKLSQNFAFWPSGDASVWRWMLAVEAIPALAYFLLLFAVPESPRWLVLAGRFEQARHVLRCLYTRESSEKIFASIQRHIASAPVGGQFRQLLTPSLRLALVIGVVVAVLQQITGINAVFFYAPMIFEQSGMAQDSAFLQAVLVGLVNVVFTLLAIALIDRVGRRPLLIIGTAGIAIFMTMLSLEYSRASYHIDQPGLEQIDEGLTANTRAGFTTKTFDSELEFRRAARASLGNEAYERHASQIVSAAIEINPLVVIAGILGFVACFALSLGPVMWVLFSELFPGHIRGLAVSILGLVNSAVSFLVQLVFPLQLQTMGAGHTFMLYAIMALVGLLILMRILPETKGHALENMQEVLNKK